MKYFLSLVLSLVIGTSFGQHIQWTLKPGALSTQVDVYLRPTFDFNPGLTPNVYFGQVQFAIGWQTSCPTAGQPTVNFTIDPAFNTNGGGSYSVAVFPQSTSTSPAGETYNVISLNRIGSGAQSYPSGVEVKVGTVTFSGSSPFCTIKIVDYADTGLDGQASCYATNSATGEYQMAPTSDGNFYSSAGNSTAGGDATSGYASLSSLTSLPVKLISFTGSFSNCTASLNWVTAEEINFNHFDVEESTDGTIYKKIGTVQANGTGGQTKYSFNAGFISGNRYYRLRMTDNDGQTSYSYVRALNGNCGSSIPFNIYPNPVRSADQSITLQFSRAEAGVVQVHVYNAAGQQVFGKGINAATGTNVHQVQLPAFSVGTYYLKLTDKSGMEIGSKQLIIQ